jgi:hypothetical protein
MRRIFLILLLGAFFVVPAFAFAAEQKPLVPCDGAWCQACHVVELGQNIINFLVIIASSIAVAIFAWAGFLMLTAAGNESQITKARGMFTNVLFGLVITLAGWLIIDTVMKWAFQGNASGQGSELYKEFFDKLGPWNQIKCVALPKYSATEPGSGNTSGAPGPGLTPGVRVPGKVGTVQCPDFNPNCNIEMLKGLGLTPDQANAMSCIAMTENSGMADGCSGTGPCGTFQISQENWRESAPAGCAASNFGSITAAQNNGPCNARTMAVLLKKNGYQPWTGCCNKKGQPWNTNARTCVANFDSKTNLRLVMSL